MIPHAPTPLPVSDGAQFRKACRGCCPRSSCPSGEVSRRPSLLNGLEELHSHEESFLAGLIGYRTALDHSQSVMMMRARHCHVLNKGDLVLVRGIPVRF